jgi:hypothetical protein
MGAFGGSYLNHQFLISGRTPEFFNAAETPAKKKIAVLEDGPLGRAWPWRRTRRSRRWTASRSSSTTAPSRRTAMRSTRWRRRSSRAGCARRRAAMRTVADPQDPSVLPPQTLRHDRRPAVRAKVSWAWYGGAWQAAIDGRGEGQRPNFQHHHQPFNYFKQFAPGTAARAEHLRDGGLGDSPISNKFIADAIAGKLPAVLLQAAGQPEPACGLFRHRIGRRPRRQRDRAPEKIAAVEGHGGRHHLRRERRLVGPRGAAQGDRWGRARAFRRSSSRRMRRRARSTTISTTRPRSCASSPACTACRCWKAWPRATPRSRHAARVTANSPGDLTATLSFR